MTDGGDNDDDDDDDEAKQPTPSGRMIVARRPALLWGLHSAAVGRTVRKSFC
jgi:hypothetical protein